MSTTANSVITPVHEMSFRQLVISPRAGFIVASLYSGVGSARHDRLFARRFEGSEYRELPYSLEADFGYLDPVAAVDTSLVFFNQWKRDTLIGWGRNWEAVLVCDLNSWTVRTLVTSAHIHRAPDLPGPPCIASLVGASADGSHLYCTIASEQEDATRSVFHYELACLEVATRRLETLSALRHAFF